MPPDQDFEQTPQNSAARELLAKRDQIIEAWENRVRREVRDANDLPRPALIDTLPKFIENVAEALTPEHSRSSVSGFNNVTMVHGGERARLSRYGPDQLVQEYLILREELLRALHEASEVHERDINVIRQSIDESIKEATVAFFLEHTKLKEQFVAAVTHDLRNPLSAAKLSNELMLITIDQLESIETRTVLRTLAERALKNTRRADRMIQDLLDAGLVQAGEMMSLRLQPCEIRFIVNEAFSDLPASMQKRITFEGPEVRGYWDPEAIRRAVENLLSNALKYGDPERPIKINTGADFGRLQLSVHNFGEPIPVAEQKLLFDAFQRAKAAKMSGKRGWGIGLTLARGVACSHGGSLLMDSSRERGTTFTLDIPEDARPYQKELLN